MIRVQFKGLFWCPKHEQSILLLSDETERPLMRILIPPQYRELVMDEINRVRSGLCGAQRLLLSFLSLFKLEMDSVVFEAVNGVGGARINLRGNGPTSMCTDDPVAALVLAISLGLPIYLNSDYSTTFLNQAESINKKGPDHSSLPPAFSKFLQDSSVLLQLDNSNREPEVGQS